MRPGLPPRDFPCLGSGSPRPTFSRVGPNPWQASFRSPTATGMPGWCSENDRLATPSGCNSRVTSSEEFSPEQIEAKWREIAPHIDVMAVRIGTVGEFAVAPDSSLAEDDAASDPYQVSQVVIASMTAAVDHLHALKVLVRDARVLHGLASYSLARGALENLSLAFWVLHPESRDLRIERALRWWAQNFKDAEKALAPRGIHDSDAEPKLAKLEAVAQTRPAISVHHKTGIRAGHSSTEAVKYADEHAQRAREVLFLWQLCSGFAHGRAWARLGVSKREQRPGTKPGTVQLKLTADESVVLWAATASLHLLGDLLRLYDQRAESHAEGLVSS